MIKYRFALSDNLMIQDIKQTREHGRFSCIECKRRMVAVLPTTNIAKHFRHYANVDSCSPESYLHKLAKLIIQQNYGDDYVIKSRDGMIDIFRLFPFIHVEKIFCGKRPDITLESFFGDLVFVEFNVTHKCESDKVKALRDYGIIEIDIKNEDDAFSLTSGIHFYRVYNRDSLGRTIKEVMGNVDRLFLYKTCLFSDIEKPSTKNALLECGLLSGGVNWDLLSKLNSFYELGGNCDPRVQIRTTSIRD